MIHTMRLFHVINTCGNLVSELKPSPAPCPGGMAKPAREREQVEHDPGLEDQKLKRARLEEVLLLPGYDCQCGCPFYFCTGPRDSLYARTVCRMPALNPRVSCVICGCRLCEGCHNVADEDPFCLSLIHI